MFICLLIVTVNCYYFYFVVLGFFSFVCGGGCPVKMESLVNLSWESNLKTLCEMVHPT